MHCQDWEERVALHVGGDLPAEAALAVEQHLAGCSGCQLLWSGLKESLQLLQAAHRDPLPDAAYTAVRARVMAELAAGRRRWWRVAAALVAAALAAAALLVLVAVAVWPLPRVQPLPRVALAVPAAPPLAYARGSEPSHDRKEVKKLSRNPVLVRLVTDDPNIVIYWIAD